MNDVLNNPLQFVSLLLIGLCVLYLRNRIKNLAQKEDIEDLTDIVEEVKQKYRSENEALKAQLDLLNNRKIQVFTEEKDAIIQFYTKINEWIWDKLNISLYEYNRNKVEALSDKMIEMDNTYNEANVLFSKVCLLVDNHDMINAGHDLILSTLKLHHLVKEHCSNYRHWLGASKASFDSLMEYIKTKPKTIDSAFAELSEEIESELDTIRKKYWETQPPVFNETIKVKNVFEVLAKGYIRTPQI